MLVAVGFIVDVMLQMQVLRTQEHKFIHWLLKFLNQMWLMLGICCIIIALYDVLVLNTVTPYPQGGNINNIIELLGRLVLFHGTFLFYSFLNNEIVLSLLFGIIGWFFLVYFKIKKGNMQNMYVIKLTFCLAIALFYCLIAAVARFDVLTACLCDYRITFPDRFYYAINISFLIPFFMSISIIYQMKISFFRYIATTVLIFLSLAPIASYQSTFPYDNPQTVAAHNANSTFSDRLKVAQYDESNGLYIIKIDLDGWTMPIPEKYIIASLEL